MSHAGVGASGQSSADAFGLGDLSLVVDHKVRSGRAKPGDLLLLVAGLHALEPGEPECPEAELLDGGFLPGRIAEDAVEAALVEDLGEGEVPVEETILAGEGFDVGLKVGGKGLALDEVAEVSRRYSDGSEWRMVNGEW